MHGSNKASTIGSKSVIELRTSTIELGPIQTKRELQRGHELLLNGNQTGTIGSHQGRSKPKNLEQSARMKHMQADRAEHASRMRNELPGL